MGVLKNDVGRPSNKTIKIRFILKAVLLIVVAGGLFLGGYLLNDGAGNKNINKENVEQSSPNTVVNEEVKEEILDINSAEVMKLYRPFVFFMRSASDEELYKKDKIIPSDLSYEYKNRLALAYGYNIPGYENVPNANIIQLEMGVLSSKILEKHYKEFFGKDEKYIAKTFSSYGIDTIEMYYDEKEDKYIPAENGGDYTYYRYAKELYKAIKKGNKIELYQYVVVYNDSYELNKSGVYKNITDANNFKNAIKEVKSEDRGLIEKFKLDNGQPLYINSSPVDDLRDYKEEASQYKITFELEDNHYVFNSIEKIK